MAKKLSRIPSLYPSQEPPHRVLNRSIEWFTRARDMLAGMPYFKSRVVSDASVTRQLDDALASIDNGIAKLVRLRRQLEWAESIECGEPFACPNCGTLHTIRCEAFASSSGFATEAFYVCLCCLTPFSQAGKPIDLGQPPTSTQGR